jgi:hypothetical protein
MSGPATAEVEVLTAEVRVLMVGSRQVTLSVARQLDKVSLANIQAFGRVRLGANVYGEYVIGKDRASSTLVVAEYESQPPVRPLLTPKRPLVVCAHWDAGIHYNLACGGRPFTLRREHAVTCQPHRKDQAPHPPRAPAYPWTVAQNEEYSLATRRWQEETNAWKAKECATWEADDATKRDLARQLEEHDIYLAGCAEARRLPLIVLAGLR